MFYKYEEWINIFPWLLFVIGILSVLLITASTKYTAKSDTSSKVISATEQLEVVNTINPIGDNSSGLY